MPRLDGAWDPGDLATSWWLERVVVVELLEVERIEADDECYALTQAVA